VGASDKRFASAYIFAAVRPLTGEDFALVFPRVSAAPMSTFLAAVAKTVHKDTYAIMVLEQAGRHDVRALRLSARVTLVPLLAYSPELNPIERVWLYPRERYLSYRLLTNYHAVAEAC
jgi:hypothetical protein